MTTKPEEFNNPFAEHVRSMKPEIMKAIEADLVAALAVYRQCLDVREAIMFIGGAGTPEAAEALRALNQAAARVHDLRAMHEKLESLF